MVWLERRGWMMSGDVESEDKTGICEWCGEEGMVYPDHNRCGECDRNIHHCLICRVDQHRDGGLCRHIFQDQNLEWHGSGIGAPNNDVKESFFKLLTLMPEGFSADLRKTIRSGRFHTWFIAPLIGPGCLLQLHGMPDRDGRFMVHEWGDAIIAIAEGDTAEETSDGYQWLASLYDRETWQANHTTITWVDEWLDAAKAAQREI